MSFYDHKRPPSVPASVPPSYISSPSQTEKTAGMHYSNTRTPYEQELDELGERRVPRPRRTDSLHNEHRAWKYGADSYFRQPPPPPSSLEKIYRTFCCGSRRGCAAWVVGIVVLLVSLAVALAFILRRHDATQAAVSAAQSSPSYVASLSTATVTLTSTPTNPLFSAQPSTFTTISVSTYSSAAPSTTVSTSTTTSTTTTTSASLSTVTSVASGTITTETKTETTVSISTVISTQPTTIFSTIVSTVLTTPSVSTVSITTTKNPLDVLESVRQGLEPKSSSPVATSTTTNVITNVVSVVTMIARALDSTTTVKPASIATSPPF